MNQNCVFTRQALHKLLPSSIIGQVACFVFYDHHPRDKRSIDVTVYTNSGEILEYYQHELISSLLVEVSEEVTDIKILRNSSCELFYLLVAKSKIIIITKKESLQVHSVISDVESYSIEDLECTGQACLKIIREDDAVPLVFDDNFVNLTQKQIELNNVQSEESLPIVKQLMTKLTEAKYTTKHNEHIYNEYVSMRQTAAFNMYEKSTFKMQDAGGSKLGLNEISNLLQVTTRPPVVKMCNEKIVIITSLKNHNSVSIKEVCIHTHSDSKQSIEHSTKVFEKISKSPHWKEIDAQINGYNESEVVGVVDLKEVQFDEASRIDFEIVVSFTKSGQIHMLPIDSVSISPLDVMGENFDIFSCSDDDPTQLMLCILATSQCFDLRLRHITKSVGDVVTLSDIFHTHLKMAKHSDNVAIHKVTPFHKLYGLTVVFGENFGTDNAMNVKVYTRYPFQIVALTHYIYDAVPHRIIVTTSDYRISEINNDLSNYNEKSQPTDAINYAGCATSMMNQIKLVKEYFDECTRKMSEDRNPAIQNKVGTEVDLMALGVPRYLEFRNKILQENLEGLKSLYHATASSDSDSEDCMIIDD